MTYLVAVSALGRVFLFEYTYTTDKQTKHGYISPGR